MDRAKGDEDEDKDGDEYGDSGDDDTMAEEVFPMPGPRQRQQH